MPYQLELVGNDPTPTSQASMESWSSVPVPASAVITPGNDVAICQLCRPVRSLLLSQG